MKNNRPTNQFFKNGIFYVIVLLSVLGIIQFFTGSSMNNTQKITQTQFITYLEDGKIEDFSMQPGAGVYKVTGKYDEPQENKQVDSGVTIFGTSDTKVSTFETSILPNDTTLGEISNLAKATDTTMTSLEQDQSSMWISLLLTVLPLVFVFFMFYMMMGQSQGGGKGVMNFGKVKSTDQSKTKSKVKFSDVAGAEEEKQELVEVVEFLKDPKKFLKLGARIPKGVLLEGPPGTGKTLLAKAVAGEAGVPFYGISGSEFVEMFVGVGASRVRDLFDNAKKTAPSIIFIDEIDAVGRKRGSGIGGGHDEREQTLNQLLVEMDGFTGTDNVIVIAATNRSDVLDPALLRPGRFDRQVLVGRPDVKGREAILKVHARNKPLADDVDLKVVAQQTPGFTGADLENVLNEAALVAARRNKVKIDSFDIDEAQDRVIAGPAKTDRQVNEKERRMVAYHEAGHTIVGLVLSDARVVHKVTIVPRGRAGGYAIMLPREDQFLYTKKDLYEQVVGLLGGRAAEEVVFNTQTTGASNDFEQATGIVRSMVTEYGMSDNLGTISYEGSHAMKAGDYMGEKRYSDDVASKIDHEVRKMMESAFAEAKSILNEHRDQLNLIAEKLLEIETLDEKTIKSLFETGQMPADSEAAAKEEPVAKSFEEVKSDLEKKDARLVKEQEEVKHGHSVVEEPAEVGSHENPEAQEESSDDLN